MSGGQDFAEVDNINSDADMEGKEVLTQFLEEISQALNHSGDSVLAICTGIEGASSEDVLRAVFPSFNRRS